MDLSTLATFISIEMARGFLKEPGKEIYERLKALLKPNELVSLNLFEQQPQDEEIRKNFTTVLETHLRANPEATRDLMSLLRRLPGYETKLRSISQVGDNNIAFQDVQGSVINVNKS